MSDVVLFDTSVFVAELRTRGHQERIQSISAQIPTLATVFAELWPGAKAAERERLSKVGGLLKPAELAEDDDEL